MPIFCPCIGDLQLEHIVSLVALDNFFLIFFPYKALKIYDFNWPCSGCVTSAETVMLEKQSLDEFLANVNNGKTVIVSLSPQSRASLAVHFGISPLQVNLTLFFSDLLLSFTYILHSSVLWLKISLIITAIFLCCVED